MKTYIVQLEDHDDIISARDKISWSKATRILLVWPRKGKVLERELDLLLLQRHARSLGMQLALITRRRMVIAHARNLGIPVFSKTEAAQRGIWRHLRGKKRPRLPFQARKAPQSLRQQRDALLHNAIEPASIRLAAFVCGVLAFFAMALFFLPEADIQLSPAQESQSMDIAVWANPVIGAPNLSGGLPAQVLSSVVEGRDQIESSGRARVPDRAAVGQVTLTNLTDHVVDVPEGSVVRTLADPPVRFVTLQPVQAPAGPGNTIVVGVQAVNPGSSGNVTAGEIQAMEGSTGLFLAVENLEPIRGGTDRTSPAPSSADNQKLRKTLLSSLEKRALEEIQGRVQPGQRLLTGTLHIHEVLEETREPVEGQASDHLQLAMRVEYQAWAIREEDLQVVAQAAFDANRKSGFQPVPGSLRVTFTSEAALDPGRTEAGAIATTVNARWNVHLERTLEASWSKPELVYALLGRNMQDAAGVLRSSLVLSAPPRIQVYPSWWARMPFLPARIHLEQP